MSDVAKMTERIRRPNYGTLELAITIDDPKTYTRPFTVNLTQNLKVDTELIDEFCLENEKSYEHAALARQVARAVNILPGRTMLRPGIPAHREFPRQTATLGPVFVRNVTFRPSVELAVGEVTTLFAVHLDGLYTIGNAGRQSGWMPYLGAGPNLSFSHRGFEGEEDGQRFDFGEFNFDGGLNFIAGARNPRGVFIEMKATAYGVANVRLLGGFSF